MEAAAGALVRRKDGRYETDEFIFSLTAAATGDQGTAIEVERGGAAPDVAPPALEDLGAGSFGGGEQRDDVAEDAVGEVADAVDAGVFTPFG